jgi:hypothetical protein
MDKDVQNAMIGGGAGPLLQVLTQKFVDPFIAPMLYSSAQYIKDLKAAGYVPQAADAGLTEEQLGTKVMETSGYTFASNSKGAPTLIDTSHLKATKDTYMAAVGQKVSPIMLPSTWGTGILGVVAAADSAYDFTGMARDYKIIEASAGASLVTGAVMRATGFVSMTAFPSGLDVPSAPTVQYFSSEVQNNLQRLSSENQRLNQELAQLRAAQPPRGLPPGVGAYNIQTTQPVVQVTEIIPGKGAEVIKQRSGIMSGGGAIQKATAESVRHQTGLVTLHGGR